MVKVIKFWAPWCGPCKQYTPIFDRVATNNTNPNVVFESVNVEENRKFAQSLRVSSIPTTILMVDGEVVDKQTGLMNESQILKFISNG